VYVALLAAFALRVFSLGSAEIGGDEAFTADFLTRSFDGIVQATFDLREPHPVGSYFIQKVWMSAVGNSEYALRMSSVLVGILACALMYRLARDLFPDLADASRIALAAAALLAVSAFAVRASRELRMYSWQLMLLTAAMLFAVRLWRRNRWSDAFGYAFAACAAMHVHYFSATVLLVLNLFALWTAGASWKKWLTAQTLLAAAVLPWLWVVFSIVGSYPGNAEVPTAWTAVVRGASALVAGSPLESVAQAAAVAAAGVLLVVGVVAARARRDARVFVLAAVVLPIFLIWLGAQSRPIFREKYLMPALPAFCLACALAGNEIARRFGRAALVNVMLLGIFAVPTAAYYRDWLSLPADWRNLMTVLRRYDALPAGATHVRINYPDPGFAYYNADRFPFAVMPYAPGNEAVAQGDAAGLSAAGVERVLLQLVPSFWDDRKIAQTALAQHFVKIDETYTGRWIVQIYGRPMAVHDRAIEGRFASGVSLDALWSRLDVRARLVEVQMRWSGDAAGLKQGRKYFIHVARRDDPGALIAQHDGELTEALLSGAPVLFGLRVHEHVSDDALAGEFIVRVGVYDGEREGYPRVPTTSGSDAVESLLEQVGVRP
jgi:hypothetical protein